MNQNRNVIIAVVAVVAVVLLLCCCVAILFAVFVGGCTTLGIGGAVAVVNMPAPNGIDERPVVPSGVVYGDLFPASAGSYEAGQLSPATSFAGVSLPGGNARSMAYNGPEGRVWTMAVQAGSEAQARQLVQQVGARVEDAAASSHLTRSLPGKPYFVQWYVSSWKQTAYGIVWNNGSWVFGVASESRAARDAVADSFPY
ncbi:MAG: hypothetical protein KKA73_17725 [Chloroflexi bacterium]|nr:hypothetical protein [Chloroflexota bacterium]MBU1749528.1 hypothetical protein [Chloroflexota bacterium]MBU1878035.1 hypothetical protein [Chloroflexota bacterium]